MSLPNISLRPVNAMGRSPRHLKESKAKLISAERRAMLDAAAP
jgi:hypothetical protein